MLFSRKSQLRCEQMFLSCMAISVYEFVCVTRRLRSWFVLYTLDVTGKRREGQSS